MNIFKESSDERVELISKKIASRGFYLLILSLAISNIIKSVVLEIDRIYWVDTHRILLGVLLLVAIMLLVEGITEVPKGDKNRVTSAVAGTMGALYGQLTSGNIKLSTGISDIIVAGVMSILIGLAVYAFLTIKDNRKDKKSNFK